MNTRGIRFQILAQAPTNETNKELWLNMPIRHIKQTEQQRPKQTNIWPHISDP